ncbi:MAG TPA: hypothetical protein PKA55_11740 [Rhodoblastus sp.]|nr:hypothetical protein [Rhodoblastus sp.]
MLRAQMLPIQASRLTIAPLLTLRASIDPVAFACAVIAACGMSEYVIALITAARAIL